MLYILIALIVFGFVLFALIMWSDGKHGLKQSKKTGAPLLKPTRLREGVHRLDFINSLDEAWLAIIAVVIVLFVNAGIWWADGDTSFPATLLTNPGLLTGSVAAVVGLMLMRFNIRTWYEFDGNRRVLRHKCRVHVPPWTGTLNTHENVHHMAIRAPRFVMRRDKREYRAVMVTRAGEEIRIATEFKERFYDIALDEMRTHAKTLDVTFIEPPANERP